ncbi:MAG: hypothetical protein WB868_00250, partial [Xanthobacteraceae bacterium]
AGEAAHETLWGTVAGAWESGERAADAALRRLGPLRSAIPAEPEARAKRKPPARARAHAERRERRENLPPRYYGGTPNIMAPER